MSKKHIVEKVDWKIPLYKIYTDDEDVNLITKIIKRGNNWALGPEIEEFENELKNYVGSDYCLTLNSGTSALHATYLAYGFDQRDNIILPSFTFIATANSVLFVNAKPNFADIEDVTFGLDPQSIRSKINKKTKAIVPVDIGGTSCDIIKIKEIAKENNLILIEDAAESLGATVNNKKVGSLSDSSIFSFCGNKVLTTGEGGAVVTNSKEVYEKIKLIRSHGRQDSINYFENPEESKYYGIGYNWRMSTMTAVLGLSQLKKLDKIIKMRQENARFISNNLKKFKEIMIPKTLNNSSHIYQMYTIRLSDHNIREKLHAFLLGKKIFCKVYFSPIHKSKLYEKKFNGINDELKMTNLISSEVLTLPMYPNMTYEEKSYIVDSISEFFEKEHN